VLSPRRTPSARCRRGRSEFREAGKDSNQVARHDFIAYLEAGVAQRMYIQDVADSRFKKNPSC
jgi:hypothetical protein